HRGRVRKKHGEPCEVAAGRLRGIGREAWDDADRGAGRIRQGRQRTHGIDGIDAVAAAALGEIQRAPNSVTPRKLSSLPALSGLPTTKVNWSSGSTSAEFPAGIATLAEDP